MNKCFVDYRISKEETMKYMEDNFNVNYVTE